MYCGHCGQKNIDEHKFCTGCGKSLETEMPNNDIKPEIKNKSSLATTQNKKEIDNNKENRESPYHSVYWWKDCEWPWQAKSLDNETTLGTFATQEEAAEAVAKFHKISPLDLLLSKFEINKKISAAKKNSLLKQDELKKRSNYHSVVFCDDTGRPWQALTLDENILLGKFKTQEEAADSVANLHGIRRDDLRINWDSPQEREMQKDFLRNKKDAEKSFQRRTHEDAIKQKSISPENISTDTMLTHDKSKHHRDESSTNKKEKTGLGTKIALSIIYLFIGPAVIILTWPFYKWSAVGSIGTSLVVFILGLNQIWRFNAGNRESVEDTFFGKSWQGEEKLWKIFWIPSVVYYTAIKTIFYLETMGSIQLANIWYFTFFIIAVPFQVWWSVSCWRCSKNTKNILWVFLTKGVVIFSCVNMAYNIVLIMKSL